jgi:probable phosphoglycerate mutase
MLLLLVRHGVTDTTGKKITGWMPGVSLSPKGLEQAKLAAQRLGDLPVAAVYSSPLERCYETAQEIARKHKLRPRRIADLGEVKYGDWTGRSLKSLYRTKAWKEMRARPSEFRFPGGESVGEAQVRVMKVIETLKRKHANEVVVACSHADLIRLAVGGHLGTPLDLYHRVSVAPASVTALWLGEFGPSLIRLGDTGSLDEIAAMFDERTSKK